MVARRGPEAPARRSSSQRVEESDWSHRGVLAAVDPPLDPPAAGFESPPPPPRPKTNAVRRLRRPVAGSPQGFTSNSRSTIDRIVKESTGRRPTRSAGVRPVPFGSGSHRPSPRLDSRSFSRSARVIITGESPEVNTLPSEFLTRFSGKRPAGGLRVRGFRRGGAVRAGR